MDKAIIGSELLSEQEKSRPEYIQRMTDNICSMLVFDKDHLRKAYNYYNGIMDKDQYRALEENYGVGSPTSVDFIPLIRKHVDSLVGRHLQNRIKPKVTCKDSNSLTNIFRQKQLQADKSVYDRLIQQLRENVSYLISDDKQNKQAPVDLATEREIQKLKDDLDRDFVSEYESAAQNVLTFLDQNKSVDLYNKKKILFLDLLVCGQCFYKVVYTGLGETPDIEVLNPIDVFYENNTSSPYVKNSTRAVVRRYLNKQQIVSRYGDKLSKDDLETLDKGLCPGADAANNVVYVRAADGSLISNVGVSTLDTMYDSDPTRSVNNYFVVYEVEWITNTKYKDESGKTRFRMDRYEAVKIGSSIYIETGKAENVVRSVEHPDRCSLSINGISYSDRNGRPFSLVISTMPLQD